MDFVASLGEVGVVVLDSVVSLIGVASSVIESSSAIATGSTMTALASS